MDHVISSFESFTFNSKHQKISLCPPSRVGFNKKNTQVTFPNLRNSRKSSKKKGTFRNPPSVWCFSFTGPKVRCIFLGENWCMLLNLLRWLEEAITRWFNPPNSWIQQTVDFSTQKSLFENDIQTSSVSVSKPGLQRKKWSLAKQKTTSHFTNFWLRPTFQKKTKNNSTTSPSWLSPKCCGSSPRPWIVSGRAMVVLPWHWIELLHLKVKTRESRNSMAPDSRFSNSICFL